MGTKESSKDQPRKFLNIKIGERLHQHLLRSRVFQQNWKAISPSFFFLNRIAAYNDASDGNPAPFFSRELARIFQPYTGGQYRTYISALSRLGLLEVDEGYELPKRVDGKKVSDGECKRYTVTELGRGLLAEGNYIYLRRFHTDKSHVRRNKKEISKRKVMHRTYGDYVLNHICDVHKHLSYSEAALESLKERFKDDPARWEHITRFLITIREKRYRELRPNEADSRVCNELALMKKDVRHVLWCGELRYRAVLDIRACHPTFWSHYVLTHIYNGGPAGTVSVQEPSSTGTLHYVPHIGDTYYKSTHPQALENKAIQREHERWVALFCNAKKDPREVIAQQAGYKDKAKLKQALNETINGSKRYGKLRRWMKERFPTLYEVWSRSEVKKTGPKISKHYETQLMLDEGLYRSAEGMGIKLSYEYDGVGVFAPEDHDGLQTQLEDLKRQITRRSDELWGIPVFVKAEVLDSP